jgi:hypothetical protein
VRYKQPVENTSPSLLFPPVKGGGILKKEEETK